jgi:hypothetical protein
LGALGYIQSEAGPVTLKSIQKLQSEVLDMQGAINQFRNDALSRIAASASITVRKNTGATDVGTQPRLNFIEGANITLTVSEDVVDREIDVTITGAAGSAETDPVFAASDVYGVTSTDISNWDTAYGWGDHAGLYEVPLTISTGLSRATNTVTVDQAFTPTWTGKHIFGTTTQGNGIRLDVVGDADGQTGPLARFYGSFDLGAGAVQILSSYFDMDGYLTVYSRNLGYWSGNTPSADYGKITARIGDSGFAELVWVNDNGDNVTITNGDVVDYGGGNEKLWTADHYHYNVFHVNEIAEMPSSSGIIWGAGSRLVFATSSSANGGYIGSSSTEYLAFWGAFPVRQYSTTGTSSGFTSGSGTAVKDDSTFTGNQGSTAYRISDIVRALKLCGIMAQ